MSANDVAKTPLTQLRHELAVARQALREPGGGAVGNLECRLADLQNRLLLAPANSLDDVAGKLEVAAGLVRELGPRGYLLDLLEATLADVRALQMRALQASAGPPSGG